MLVLRNYFATCATRPDLTWFDSTIFMPYIRHPSPTLLEQIPPIPSYTTSTSKLPPSQSTKHQPAHNQSLNHAPPPSATMIRFPPRPTHSGSPTRVSTN